VTGGEDLKCGAKKKKQNAASNEGELRRGGGFIVPGFGRIGHFFLAAAMSRGNHITV